MFLYFPGLNKVPSPVRGIQCATQAAVESFAACLRQEMRPRGVDVCVVAAGEFAPGNGWLNETELREQVQISCKIFKIIIITT